MYYLITYYMHTCPLPSYLRFYTWTLLQRRVLVTDRVRLPHRWCSFYFSSIEFLPTVFHTASIWLTVCLAIQRYVCVSRLQPTASKSAGRQTGIKLLIATVYVAAALSQTCRFFEYRSVQFLYNFAHIGQHGTRRTCAGKRCAISSFSSRLV